MKLLFYDVCFYIYLVLGYAYNCILLVTNYIGITVVNPIPFESIVKYTILLFPCDMLHII